MQRHHAVLVAEGARSRDEVVDIRRLAAGGWLLVAIGVLIPFLAVGGAVTGLDLLRAGERHHGWALIATALVVFAARLAIFVS